MRAPGTRANHMHALSALARSALTHSTPHACMQPRTRTQQACAQTHTPTVCVHSHACTQKGDVRSAHAPSLHVHCTCLCTAQWSVLPSDCTCVCPALTGAPAPAAPRTRLHGLPPRLQGPVPKRPLPSGDSRAEKARRTCTPCGHPARMHPSPACAIAYTGHAYAQHACAKRTCWLNAYTA
jgi:hypothetical protein